MTADLIGTKDACRILDVDKSTITRWVRSGVLTPVLRVGAYGAYVFQATDVQRLHEERQSARVAHTQ